MATERARAALLAALLLAGTAASAAELSGRLTVVSARSGRPARGVDVTQAVVAYLPPGEPSVAVPEQPYEMATVRKSFEPEVLVVPVGATVTFPNFDPILHNVFSITPNNAFDVGVYGRGEGKSARFTRPGVVRVFCNVHQSMYAHILVLATPFFQTVEADGSFHLTGLPAGRGRLTVWHPQGSISTRPTVVPQRGLRLTVEADRRRVPPHLNKFGKPYRSRRDRYNG